MYIVPRSWLRADITSLWRTAMNNGIVSVQAVRFCECLISWSNKAGVDHQSGDVSPSGDGKTSLRSFTLYGHQREAASLIVTVNQPAELCGRRMSCCLGRACVCCVYVCVCVCLWVVVGLGGGGVLVLPRQQPQLCNIIWCGVNKKHPAMCAEPFYQRRGGHAETEQLNLNCGRRLSGGFLLHWW